MHMIDDYIYVIKHTNNSLKKQLLYLFFIHK